MTNPTAASDNDRPRVVCVGGGHGLAQVLQAVSPHAGSLQAVVTVADDGGSSGRLVPGLDIPPPGDIRRCILALTPGDSLWRRLFEYRFAGSDVRGHSLGNLLIAALSDLEGGFAEAVGVAEDVLGTTGSVIPAAAEHLRLGAEIQGHEVRGQATISRARGHIDRMWVSPPGISANEQALAALAAADQIVLGPGSLYTSVIAALIVPGIVETINTSTARVVFVGNLITQDGETLGMDMEAHLEALLTLTGVRLPDAIVAGFGLEGVVPPLEPVRVDQEALERRGTEVVLVDLVDRAATWPQHDPIRLGEALSTLRS